MTSCSSCVTAYGKSSTLCGPATRALRELSVPGPSRSNFAGQVFLKVGRALATTAFQRFFSHIARTEGMCASLQAPTPC